MSRCNTRPTVLRLIFALPALNAAALADDVFWVNPAGGLFSDHANWSTQTVPGPADRAVFDLAALGYAVLFNAAAATGELLIRSNNVTFDLDESQYDVAGPFGMGISPNDSGQLTVKNGALAVFGPVSIGERGAAALIVEQAGIIAPGLNAGIIAPELSPVEIGPFANVQDAPPACCKPEARRRTPAD